MTISLTSQSKPQPPLYGFVYGNTRPYSQTRSSSQRELMQPDEILRLDRCQCIALFQGRKPALLYKLTPEELPGYDALKSCRVADYTPEWRLKEERKKAQAAKKWPRRMYPSRNRLRRQSSRILTMSQTRLRAWNTSSPARAWAWWSWGLTAWWAVRMRMKNSRREGDPGGSEPLLFR